MKCPKCSYDQKAKLGLKCGGCGYRFTFNPKTTPGLTDGKFLGCIQSASQNDTVWFTENQLYSVFLRKSPRAVGCAMVLGVLLLIGGCVLAFKGSGMAGIPLVVIAVGLIIFSLKNPQGPGVSLAKFKRHLDRWRKDDKPIGKLLQEPSLHEPPPEWDEPDIYDYGVERILIVERDILVDMFVKNGLHAEQRMLVVAESGYPDYLVPVAERLLNERKDLPVFLLHDATLHGIEMEERVLESGILPIAGHPLTDLGMFPKDFRKLSRTQHFDPKNEDRSLPADAMMLPFLTMGLGAAMLGGIAFSAMLEEEGRRSMVSGGMDFG